MFSTLDRLNRLKDALVDWHAVLTLLVHLVAYVAILALMAFVAFLILKYIVDPRDETAVEEIRVTETNPLWSGKAMSFTYGTYGKDLEAGNCSKSSSNSNSNSSSNSTEELYDGKLCIICYDEERNCFFVPCGHCATCYVCAQRIFNGENKVCPACRRPIGKVRKLFAP